jgi:Domain of unknown function (DU1801)
MQINAASREEHFEAAGPREGELRQLDAIIREYAPALTPVLSAGMGSTMLGYGEQPYLTKSMKEPGVWAVIALAAQKRYLSLYVSVLIDGECVPERYASELGKVTCGKVCIRFAKIDKLNLETVKKILVDVNTRYAVGEKLYGS